MSETKTQQHHLELNKLWRLRNKELIKDYEKRRKEKIANDPVLKEKQLKKQRDSYMRNIEKRRQYDKNRDKQKLRARGIVRNWIYKGKLKRLPCEKCGCVKSQAHHADYTKPLDIQWLCAKHHKEIHHANKN